MNKEDVINYKVNSFNRLFTLVKETYDLKPIHIFTALFEKVNSKDIEAVTKLHTLPFEELKEELFKIYDKEMHGVLLFDLLTYKSLVVLLRTVMREVNICTLQEIVYPRSIGTKSTIDIIMKYDSGIAYPCPNVLFNQYVLPVINIIYIDVIRTQQIELVEAMGWKRCFDAQNVVYYKAPKGNAWLSEINGKHCECLVHNISRMREYQDFPESITTYTELYEYFIGIRPILW